MMHHAGMQIYGEGVTPLDVVEGRAATGLRDFANLYALLEALQVCGEVPLPASRLLCLLETGLGIDGGSLRCTH